MDMKLVAMGAIVALVVAGIGTYLVVNHDADDSPDGGDFKLGNLTVLGNADNDDDLDNDDVSTIEGVIASGSWDKSKNPLADANNDGRVDADDVSYLRNLMKRSEADPTVMYYYNSWNEIGSLRFPVTGNIGTMYWEQADLSILLGLWDRVKAVGYGSLNEIKNPGWESLYSYGKGYNAEPEVVAKSNREAGVTAVIAYIQSDGSAKEIDKYLKGTQSPIDLVCLPLSMNARVVTGGVLFCAEERSEKYMSYQSQVIDYMSEKLSKVKDAPTCVTIMMKADTSTSNIRFLNMSVNGESNGLYTYMKDSPSKVYVVEPTSSYATHTDIEWLNLKNPDWILCCSSGAWKSGNTREQNQAQFDQECKDWFSSTTAYSKKQIIGTANGTMNSFFGCFAYLKLLSFMYDEIDVAYANEVMQKFFDEGFAYFNLENMPNYQFYRVS